MESEKNRRDKPKPTTNLYTLTPMKKDGVYNYEKFPGMNTDRNHDLILNKIIELRVQGESMNKIYGIIVDEYNLSKPTVGVYVQEALELIKARSTEFASSLVASHTERYEEAYKWFRENDLDRLAMRALFLKEKLHGLHSEMIEMEFNTFFVDKKISNIRLTNLSPEKQKRLEQLLKKVTT